MPTWTGVGSGESCARCASIGGSASATWPFCAGVSQSVVSRTEHGRLDELSFGALDAIAAALDVTVFLDATLG